MDFADFKISSITTLTINIAGIFEDIVLNLIIAVIVGLLAPLLKSLVLLIINKIKKNVKI